MHGMDMWERSQTNQQLPVHALTAGSLQGTHILLTAAFTDQLNSIGWQHLLKGRMSHQWGAAVASFRKEPNDATSHTKWTAQAIAIFWKYLRVQHGKVCFPSSIYELGTNNIVAILHYNGQEKNSIL